MITVWELRSVDGQQVVRVIRPMWPDDLKFQHEYQTVVFRGYLRDWIAKGKS